VLSTDVPEEVVRRVQTDEVGEYHGLCVRSVLRRRYPLGDFAPHLLGYVSLVSGDEELDALRERYGETITPTSRIGRRGLERAYNGQLHGAPGRQVLARDEQGAFSEIAQERPPGPGRRLSLSLRARASLAAQEVLERVATREGYFPGGVPSAAFVMLDARSGEILVWAETPRFDLNDDLDDLFRERPGSGVPDAEARVWNPRGSLPDGVDLETWRRTLNVPEPRSLSRAAQIPVEPGSAFKPFIALAMLESGLALPFDEQPFHCGSGSRRPRCHGCGWVGLEEALASSCNPFFAFSLRDFPQWKTWRRSVPTLLGRLGFGRRPGGEIPEWSPGQWLRDWWDFPPTEVVEAAREWLAQRVEGTIPEWVLSVDPRTPRTVAGDPAEIGSLVARAALHVARTAGVGRVRIHVVPGEADAPDRVGLRIGIRAEGPAPWFALPSPAGTQVPAMLAGLARRGRAGLEGDLLRGGTLWFDARFDARVGRASPEEPTLIRPGDGRNVAIGQGPVLVTPLQMARAIAVFANGGRLVEPHAVRRVGERTQESPSEDLGLDPRHLERVRQGLYLAVNGPTGTARRFPWHELPATVHGKTGTAQVGAGWRPFVEEKEGEPWHQWFVGFAEGAGPPLAFACVMHSRREDAASLTAVPACLEILRDWYASVGSGEEAPCER